MVRLRAQFDGKVLVPEEPVSLPTGVTLDVIVVDNRDSSHSDIMALAGVGAEIWKGIDGVEYQRQEREGWE